MKLTITDVKNEVKAMGLICRYDSDMREFCVRIPGCPDEDYFTDDKLDAIGVAREMRIMWLNS